MPDLPQDTSTSATLTVGGTYSDTLEVNGDRDWVRIDLDPGQYVSVSLTGNTLNDPIVGIYDSAGQFIAENDDGGGNLNSQITVGSTAGGTFYIEAAAYEDTGSGTYTLSAVTTSPPVPTDALDSGRQRTDTADPITVYFVPAGQSANFNDGDPNDDSDEIVSEGWSAYERERFEAALASIAAVTNVTFLVTTDPNADFQLVLDSNEFDSSGSLGYFYLPGGSSPSMGAFNANGSGWNDTGGLEAGGLGYATIVHEVLHGLGLEHPHDGQNVMSGVGSAFGDFGDFLLNQGIFTTMSYNGGLSGVSGRTSSRGNEAGPMALDIAAIQDLYGRNMSTATGDDVYLLDDTQDNDTAWQSIWDAGGEDTVRYDGTRNTVIDLREATLRYEDGGGGFISSAAGVTGGFTIANGAAIENAIGGHGNDDIFGNGLNNGISGRGGNDDIASGSGNDTVEGNAGQDTINATSGTNTFYGGSGNDTIAGGAGNDTIFGGSGNDVITDAGGQNALFGGRGNDTITGGGANDRIVGGMGQDTMNGGAGADTFVFEFASDSYAGTGNRDTINGFVRGTDKIDLSNIDGLSFSSGTSFSGSGTGQIITQANLVRIDIDGDGSADMEIAVFSNAALGAGDFIL